MRPIDEFRRWHIPYSHSRVGPDWYRADCSGFVSWVWEIPPRFGNGGPRTWDWYCGPNGCLYDWSEPIAQHELRRYDILIRRHHHVMLFDRWDEAGNAIVWEMANHHECRGFHHHAVNTRRFGVVWDARRMREGGG